MATIFRTKRKLPRLPPAVRMRSTPFLHTSRSTAAKWLGRDRDSSLSVPRMILALRVPLELIPVEVHFAQIAARIARRLVVEVLRFGMSTFSTRRHRARPHLIAELDHCNETIAARAVPLLRARIRARAERSERSPG